MPNCAASLNKVFIDRYIVFVLDVCLSVSVCLSEIVSAPYLQDGLKDFHETWVTYSPHQGDVQNPCLDHAGSRSRSCLKVKGLRSYFVSAPYLQDGGVGCSPHQGDVQNPHVSTIPVQGQGHA